MIGERVSPEKQALAAIGQALLCAVGRKLLGLHGHTAAQILLTNDTFQIRERYLNLQATWLNYSARCGTDY